MPASNFRFAKIVATPTRSSWAQAYHAGNVFAIVTLSQTSEEDAVSLQTIGKDIINNLEAEFFALAEKNLESIKAALLEACKDAPESVILGVSLAYCKDNTLYLFILNDGKINIKRENTYSTILYKDGTDEKAKDALVSASGHLEKDDIVILQTSHFSSVIPEHELLKALTAQEPSEVAEALNPHVHGTEQGGAAAVILSFQGVPKNTQESDEETEEETRAEDPPRPAEEHAQSLTLQTQSEDVSKHQKGNVFLQQATGIVKQIIPRLLPHITHRKKVFLSIAVIIGLLLLISITLTIQNQESSRQKNEFQTIYDAAKKDYDEGLSLLSLNKPLARDDFNAAKTTLTKGKAKFKSDSEEYTKINGLLQDVEKQLAETEESYTVDAQKAAGTDSLILSAKNISGGIAAATYDDGIILLTRDGVYDINGNGEKGKKLIPNDDDWTNAIAMGTFGSNIYILDKTDGVLKFVAGADGFGKTSYFPPSKTPDTKKAVAMTIDGSVYILFTDGTIGKFTKGSQDTFAISGVDTPLTTPTALTTTSESEFLYVLDRGSSRIVVLKKDGSYQKQLRNDILKNATALDLHEKDSLIYALSEKDIYKLSIK